ncbi:adenylyl-sulfate kinase [Rhodoblastus sp.]|uniref:adenylyl-sulfate kinase n=1 Tax=Rhodoblastus sp. TaxID=1962975 RepID=UPI00260D2D59|nr:adenylyl-sulfate kinase [Rhodoblastus sp.]
MTRSMRKIPARDSDDSMGLPTLRLLTCGSVDDGKSTLIGRILYDRGLVPDDQLVTLERDSRKFGTTGDDLDLALLVDGLEAEQQQGITIDVAYRYFSTDRRSFIIADTPGHEQYTRNMATGAANCDLAILLIDARKGVLDQTLRHMALVSMLGIRHVVLAINKMDMVNYNEAVFNAIVTDFSRHASGMGFRTLVAIPMSARFGANVTARSTYMPWHQGPCLLDYLETIDVADEAVDAPLRFPIQWVNRPNLDFRGMSGTVMSGRVRVGDEICIADTGLTTHVARIVTMDGDRESAEANDSVTLVFTEEIDATRGDVICHVADRPVVVEQFAAHLFWMGAEKLLPGRSYFIKVNGRTVPASVTEIKHRLNISNQEKMAAKTLRLNEIGFCNISTTRALCIDPFEHFRNSGAFLLIDRTTNATVAIGTIAFPLRRASNVHLQHMSVTKEVRSALKQQKPVVLWFTGLSGSGKSTVANLVEMKLAGQHAHTITLDGDNLRHGLNRDLGFTDADRVENIRRVGEVSKLMVDAGLIVLSSFISPFEAERRMVRELLDPGEFVEIFVDTPLEVCIQRDHKGLYKRALAGEIKNFTGVDQPYERPENAEIVLTPDDGSAEKMAERIVNYLRDRQVVAAD